MQHLTLGKKISLDFGIILALALILGGTGYWGAWRTGAVSHYLNSVEAPTVVALTSIQEDVQRIKVAQRNLLVSSLDEETRARQFENLDKARTDYEAAFKSYAPPPKSKEEAAHLEELQAGFAQWRHDNHDFMRLVRELGDMKVGNPDLLRRNLEIFRGDHYALGLRTPGHTQRYRWKAVSTTFSRLR